MEKLFGQFPKKRPINDKVLCLVLFLLTILILLEPCESNAGQWTEMSSGTSERPNDVWGFPGGDVIAAGDGGTIIRTEYTEEVQDFVTRFYQICLDREPDPDGLNYWVSSLLDGSKTGADVARGFIFSQEFVNRNVSNEDYLVILYEAFFARQPDTDGYNHWLDQLEANVDRPNVLDGFIYSVEFGNLCADYGITPYDRVKDFVTRFYRLCLGRDPDQAGLSHWVDSLKDGSRTGADVAYGFVFSHEFMGMNTSNEEYLAVLYNAFFDRGPDQGGYQYWLAQLDFGARRIHVLDGFIYAQEFCKLCDEYGITPSPCCPEDEKVTVEEVSLHIDPYNPEELFIQAIGTVSTAGWSNARLIPWVYDDIPEDGIVDFDFVATRPSGWVLPVETSVEAASKVKTTDWIKGVRVHGGSNQIEMLL